MIRHARYLPIIAVTLLLAACTAQNVTSQAAIPETDNFGVPFAANMPADIRRFVVRRQGCDHFRGEPPYGAERAQFLKERIAETCTGTDAELAGLKRKYADNANLSAMLAEFEENIEL